MNPDKPVHRVNKPQLDEYFSHRIKKVVAQCGEIFKPEFQNNDIPEDQPICLECFPESTAAA